MNILPQEYIPVIILIYILRLYVSPVVWTGPWLAVGHIGVLEHSHIPGQ